MKWTGSKASIVVALFLVSAPSFSAHVSKTIYGLNQAQYFHGSSDGDFYIQLGYFSNKNNAFQLAETIRPKSHYPVVVYEENRSYIVKVGPITSSAKVREVGQALRLSSTPVQYTDSSPLFLQSREPFVHSTKSKNSIWDGLRLKNGRWFVAGGVGAQRATIDGRFTVNNGSDAIAPYNLDSYSTDKTNTTALISIEGGHRWQRDRILLPAYALSLRYQHIFPNNVGGQITQFSSNDFINYNYDWKISSDILSMLAKVDLFRYRSLLPYVSAGVGAAFNHATSYSETALANVTPRVSPGFADHSNTVFTYSLGAGIDYQLHSNLIVSLGYEFQDLGKISSGSGTSTWAGTSLRSSSFKTNNILLSFNYLFDKSNA